MGGKSFGEKLEQCFRKLGERGGICDATSVHGTQSSVINPFREARGPVQVRLADIEVRLKTAWLLPDHSVLSGAGSRLVLADGAEGDLLGNSDRSRGNRGIEVYDISLDGNGTRQNAKGRPSGVIHLTGVSDFNLTRISIKNSLIYGYLAG